MSLWHCCFISFMLHFWFPPESCFFFPPLHIFISVSVYAYLKSHVPPCPCRNGNRRCRCLCSRNKKQCASELKCRTTSSKGQTEERGHTKAWTCCWINTLIGGNYVLGAPVGFLSSARGPHKYTFKRHVARSRSNLLTMNLRIMVFITNSFTVALWRNQQSSLNINTCKWMLCLFELSAPLKSWDTVCLVAALETQTEISNASGPWVAQTSSTFVWRPPGLRWRWFSALDNMFWKYLCCEICLRSWRSRGGTS